MYFCGGVGGGSELFVRGVEFGDDFKEIQGNGRVQGEEKERVAT